MWTNILLSLGGLVLFIYGILQLNSAVQRFFSLRIRSYINRAVQKPIYGVFVGIISSFLAQSSSASNILTIGMVSAGLITFYQSLGLLLGAGIGGAFTAQLIAWKITTIAPIFIVVGFILWLCTHNKKKIFGEMIFYFGLLFFGLGIIELGIGFLKDSPMLMVLLTEARIPIIGVLIGAILAILLQASAIPIGLLVVFAQRGLVDLHSAMPIVLGAFLGTSIDAAEVFAAITSRRGGKRVALANFLIRLITIIIVLIFFHQFLLLLKLIYSQSPYQIAFGNVLLSFVMAAIGLIILKPFSALIKKIIPDGEKSVLMWAEYLDPRYIIQPKIALKNSLKELRRMSEIVQEMFTEATNLNFNFSRSGFKAVEYTELVIDNLQKEILVYLDKVSKQKMTREESSRLLYYSIMVDDIERIADLSLNLAKLGQYQKRYNIDLSQPANDELGDNIRLTRQNIEDAISLFVNPEPTVINKIMEQEVVADDLFVKYRQNHFERFFNGICRAEAGPIFIEILVNLEQISDHCKNIADYWQNLKEQYL